MCAFNIQYSLAVVQKSRWTLRVAIGWVGSVKWNLLNYRWTTVLCQIHEK